MKVDGDWKLATAVVQTLQNPALQLLLLPATRSLMLASSRGQQPLYTISNVYYVYSIWEIWSRGKKRGAKRENKGKKVLYIFHHTNHEDHIFLLIFSCQKYIFGNMRNVVEIVNKKYFCAKKISKEGEDVRSPWKHKLLKIK